MSGNSINFDDKTMLNITVKCKKSKFNKLSNSLNIKLTKGNKKYIQYMVDYINKGENIIKIPINLSNKNKCMAYCSELPYGILLILAK